MADGERGRDSRRKKFYPNREREEKNYGSRRLPIILTKPDGDKEAKGGKNKPQENAEKPLSQPTIILSTRDGDNRAVSPSQRSARGEKKNETPAPLYHLAPKTSSSENTNALALPPEMTSSVKLINDQFQMLDSCLEFLTDQTDFIVIGCVGPQGAGKSTLMSHLAVKSCVYRLKGAKLTELLCTIFNTQSLSDQIKGNHCTDGVDFYISPDRVIYLDCQPILSHSTSLDINLLKIPSSSQSYMDSMFFENLSSVLSLQLTAFLMSVCHVVLFVQDTFNNPNHIGFLHTAAMLKPPTNTSAEDCLVEYFPQIMFVHTHCSSEDFSLPRVKLIQDWYSKAFSKSMLQIHSGIGIANGGVIDALTPTSLDQEPLNLFLLPSLVDEEPNGHFQGHPGYEDLLIKMKQQLTGITTYQLSTTQLL
ncbi:nonsense-mediated mRNA decay factor SMG9-like [Macrosteles quadrilineatus]|uniref:nonsense-mediated mRNA decay factor SMG9-like n=1 Tax=Macrosteles quadrilineatus TaxID=74068 RepID=UPI0023E12B69|nr:nonsense-mediated mRNA decay factor SMG9-like [Macrosteles quadrilineatus]